MPGKNLRENTNSLNLKSKSILNTIFAELFNSRNSKVYGELAMLNKKVSGSIFALALFSSFSCLAEDWSKLEIEYKRGTLDTPEFAGGGDEKTEIWTVQYAGSWSGTQTSASARLPVMKSDLD
jgi:hypothetical protein